MTHAGFHNEATYLITSNNDAIVGVDEHKWTIIIKQTIKTNPCLASLFAKLT